MREHSDDHLVRYLLGDLPADEAERLDERSVTDAEFSLRLREIENDLVDRYARGEPFDAALQQLDRAHRTSPHLRHKVRFARALSALTARGDRSAAPVLSKAPSGRFVWWAAAAAVIAAVAIGYLSVRNLRLRDELARLEERRSTAERQNAQIRKEQQRAPIPPAAPTPVTATFLLAPPRRGIGTETPTISIPRGAAHVTLRLQVESAEHATYWAALRDPATGRIVWRGGDVAAEVSAGSRFAAITVPASVLAAQRYSVDLSGISANGSAELIGQYPIRVVLE